MTFELLFREIVTDGGVRRSGDVVLRREHPIQIPVIEGEETFALYVDNGSEHFVTVLVPETAELTVADVDGRQTIRLMQTWANGRPSLDLSPGQ